MPKTNYTGQVGILNVTKSYKCITKHLDFSGRKWYDNGVDLRGYHLEELR